MRTKDPGGGLSDVCEVVEGIPQGSVLSARLFTIFLNQLPKLFKKSHCMLYADDLQFYKSSPIAGLHDAIEAVNQELIELNIWCNNHGMIINASKSQVMVLGSRRLTSQADLSGLSDVLIGRDRLPFVLE